MIYYNFIKIKFQNKIKIYLIYKIKIYLLKDNTNKLININPLNELINN